MAKNNHILRKKLDPLADESGWEEGVKQKIDLWLLFKVIYSADDESLSKMLKTGFI